MIVVPVSPNVIAINSPSNGIVVHGGPARAAAFVRPAFAHQNSASLFGGGQMVSPPHPSTAAATVTSSTASLFDKPPASPMDTSDSSISTNSISSSNAGTATDTRII